MTTQTYNLRPRISQLLLLLAGLIRRTALSKDSRYYFTSHCSLKNIALLWFGLVTCVLLLLFCQAMELNTFQFQALFILIPLQWHR